MFQISPKEKEHNINPTCVIIEDNHCVPLEHGGSKMPQPDETFELTDCPDPKCYICTMHKGGYPSASQIENGHIKLNPYHKKKLTDSLAVLLTFLERAA